jgi:hypothetical protein
MDDSELEQACRTPFAMLPKIYRLTQRTRFAKLALSSSRPKVAAVVVALEADPAPTEAARMTSDRGKLHFYAIAIGRHNAVN